MVERIGNGGELALGVISKLRDTGGNARGRRRRGDGEQVAIAVISVGGNVAERVGHSEWLAKAVVSVRRSHRVVGVNMGCGDGQVGISIIRVVQTSDARSASPSTYCWSCELRFLAVDVQLIT